VEGTVFVPFDQPGFVANTLLSGGFTTSVELEATEAPEAEAATEGDPEPAAVAGESA
jgi:hypothetical protein